MPAFQQADRIGAELVPPPPPREPHRTGSRSEGEHPDPVGHEAQEPRRVLSGLQLIRLEDRHLARVLGEPRLEIRDDREAVAQVEHERADIEHDLAPGGLDNRRVTVEDADELALCGRGRFHEGVLHPRLLEQPARRAIRGVAGGARDQSGERLQVRWQPLAEHC
jgi:hypothetical protein